MLSFYILLRDCYNKTMPRFDLHLHSNNSDGSATVKELVDTVVQSGIKIFALTDHDTVNGVYTINKAKGSLITVLQVRAVDVTIVFICNNSSLIFWVSFFFSPSVIFLGSKTTS